MELPIISAPMAQTPQQPLTIHQQARNRINAWIAGTGITQTELALRVGRNQAWLSRYLHGDYDADLEMLQKIAEVFKHTLASLLDTPADPDEAKLIEGYRALRPQSREIVLGLIAELNRATPRGQPTTRR